MEGVRPTNQNAKWEELVNVACNMNKILMATSGNEMNENDTDYVVSNNDSNSKADAGNSNNNFNQLTMAIDTEYYNEKQKEQSKPHAVTTIQSSSLKTIDTLIAPNIMSPKNNTLAGQYNEKDDRKVHNSPVQIFKWISKEEIKKNIRKNSLNKGKFYRRIGKHVHISNVILNKIAQGNTHIVKNTVQDGCDKQDKKIANRRLPIIKSRQDLDKNYERNHSFTTVQTTKTKMPNSLFKSQLIMNDINTKLGFVLVSVTQENSGVLFTYLCYVEHMTALGKGYTKREAMESAANHLYEEYVQGNSIAKYISKLTSEQ